MLRIESKSSTSINRDVHQWLHEYTSSDPVEVDIRQSMYGHEWNFNYDSGRISYNDVIDVNCHTIIEIRINDESELSKPVQQSH